LLEEQFVRLNGEIIDVEVAATTTSFKGRPAVQVVCRNITDRKRAEQELRMFRKAVQASADAIFMTGVDGTITFVNDEFSRMYGFTPAEVVGETTPRVLKSGVVAPEVYETFWKTILANRVAKVDLTNRAKDGRLISVEGMANPILDDHGSIVGFLAIQRDVTERIRVEQAVRESEKNLRWLVENIEEPVGMMDPEERFIFANPTMCRLFGVMPGELIGLNVSEFLDPQSFEFVKSQTRLRRVGVRNRYGLQIRHRNGQEKKIELIATPQFDTLGNFMGVVAVGKDLSKGIAS
jgi:PAS domain S-box-containing protein